MRKGNGRVALSGAARLTLGVLIACCTGCAGFGQGFDKVRDSAYFPETFSLGGTVGYDDDKGWDRKTVGGNFTWRLKPRFVVPVPTPTPKHQP